MLNKNEVIDIYICDMSSEGYGIGKLENSFTIFIEGAVEEDYCKIKIVKIKKNYAYGKILEILKKSKYRIKEKCDLFYKCGGCNLQHLKYEYQLKFKIKKVEDSLIKIGKFNVNYIKSIIEDIMPSKNIYRYRNKVQFPVRYLDGNINIGFFSKRTHSIVNCKDCIIQNEINKEIIKIIYDHINFYNIKPYNEINNTGIIRHIVTRIGVFTEEVMICLVINSNKNEKSLNSESLVKELLNIKNIKSIILNFNTNKTNKILGDNFEVLWGKNYITDYIGDIKFKISCNSFFQINPFQTKLIYDKVLEFSNLNKNDILIDAYCGIGTISLFLAKYVKKVYGIEVVKSAIIDAKENAKINKIKNVEFIEGRVEEKILEIFKNSIKVNTIILDPPRKGCHIEVLNSILEIKPDKIIYISCNPSTLARDLNILSINYKLKKIKPFDMFPQTYHTEVVALLENKE